MADSSNLENEKANAESEAARLGLGAEDLELIEQIKKAKGITHTLKASDLVGLSKEEKLAKFKETQELFRKERSRIWCCKNSRRRSGGGRAFTRSRRRSGR